MRRGPPQWRAVLEACSAHMARLALALAAPVNAPAASLPRSAASVTCVTREKSSWLVANGSSVNMIQDKVLAIWKVKKPSRTMSPLGHNERFERRDQVARPRAAAVRRGRASLCHKVREIGAVIHA